MSVSHKHDDLPTLYNIFHGKVVSVQKYGIFVEIPGYEKHGLIHVSQMSSAHIEDPGEMLSRGEMVYCKVITIDEESGKVGLSMKLVNQTTGLDLDPNNVKLSVDARRKKAYVSGRRPPIELGAVYDTTCRNCGGHGHLAMECFVAKGSKKYDILPELEDMVFSDSELKSSKHSSHKRKKEKRRKSKRRSESCHEDGTDRHVSEHKRCVGETGSEVEGKRRRKENQ